MKISRIMQIIGVTLVTVGIIGDIIGPGYYFWLSALGAIILLSKKNLKPRLLSTVLSIISLVVLLYFVITLLISF